MRITTALAILAISLLTLTLPAKAQDWSILRQFDYSSIARIVPHEASLCTAWRIKDAIYITASHCTQDVEDKRLDEVGVGPFKAKVILVDPSIDLAAIFIPKERLKGGRLFVSRENLQVGDSVAGVGFGGGSDRPYFTYARVSAMSVPFGPEGMGGLKGMLIFGGLIQGMSGGPILNQRGEVVGVSKGTGPPFGIFHDIAVIVPTEDIRRFIMRLPG